MFSVERVEILEQTVAVIPAGGGSTRLGGVDKTGLRNSAGESLLSAVLGSVEAVGIPRSQIVVVAPEQVLQRDAPGYSEVRSVVEKPPGAGPAAALLAGMRSVSVTPQFILSVAGDMPYVRTGVEALYATALEDMRLPTSEAPHVWVAYDSQTDSGENRPQYLLALYRYAALSDLAKGVPSHNQSVRSLQHHLRSRLVAVPSASVIDIDTWETAAAIGWYAPKNTSVFHSAVVSPNTSTPQSAAAPEPAVTSRTNADSPSVTTDSPSVTWDEAMHLVHRTALALGVEQISLGDAIGRVTVHTVYASRPIPHYDSSAMDGYAVAGAGPWRVRTALGSVSEPGRPFPGNYAPINDTHNVHLTPGEAVPIVTGGVVPAGTDCIIREEHAIIRHEGGVIYQHNENTSHTGSAEHPDYSSETATVLTVIPDSTDAQLVPGQHIRRAGEETAPGEVVVPAGTRLTPAHIAYLAIAGIDSLAVRHQPRVALILTGSEIISHGIPAPGQVRDCFTPSLPAVVQSLGAQVVMLRHVPDNPPEVHAALDAALGDATGADLVITTGGTASSAVDHIRPFLQGIHSRYSKDFETTTPDVYKDIGINTTRFHTVFSGLKMRPGHPTQASLIGSTLFIALPGNPLAALTALRVSVQPALEAMLGLPMTGSQRVRATVSASPKKTDSLIPAYRGEDGLWRACHATGPNMLRGLAASEGFLVLPRQQNTSEASLHPPEESPLGDSPAYPDSSANIATYDWLSLPYSLFPL